MGRELVIDYKKFDFDLEFFPVIRVLAVSMSQTRLYVESHNGVSFRSSSIRALASSLPVLFLRQPSCLYVYLVLWKKSGLNSAVRAEGFLVHFQQERTGAQLPTALS